MSDLLKEIAEATSLREGAEGVRRVVECVARGRGEGVPLKELARAAGLPLPVATAVRREFEKRGFFARGGGVRLTEEGEAIVAALGIVSSVQCVCENCGGGKIIIPDEFKPALEKLEAAAAKMPVVDVTLDQAYALPETAMRRALYALECGALSGRNVLFLGDDDLVSLASAFVLKHVCGDKIPPGRLVVLEIDDRISGLIKEESSRIGIDVKCVPHDLREPLPVELESSFHSFFTDPPYTLDGLRLFLSRGAQALEKQTGMQGFLSFAHRDPDADVEVFRIVSEFGFAPVEVTPGFNFYSGAEIIGNTSRMMRLVAGSNLQPAMDEGFDGAIYSGQLKVTKRIYECAGCRRKYRVGANCKFKTIEILKEAGCPNCSGEKFKLKEKKEEK